MAENTKIEWAHHTFNPWTGCTKVSPACDHCYAEGWAKRSGLVQWGPHAERRRTSAANWKQPIKWNAEAERLGIRYRVFCASLADVFDNAVPKSWRADLFQLIERTPYLDWLLVTKRVGNVRDMAPVSWIGGPIQHGPDPSNIHGGWPPNIWLGITVVNQFEADRDIPKLLAVNAGVRFLSMEPLLGPVDLGLCDCDKGSRPGPDGAGGVTCQRCGGTGGSMVDWVIVGGESGPGARPMHPDWARSLRDQCQEAGVPFLFKQHGEWLATEFCDDDEAAMIPSNRMVYVRPDGSFHDGVQGVDFLGGEKEMARIGKKAAGRLLDGCTWDEVPA